MLGCFSEIYPELDTDGLPHHNVDDSGMVYEQKLTETKQVTPDPKHEARFVLDQIADNNSGFVLDFSRSYPNSTAAQRQEIMGYYPLDFLPALHTLAREFTICDRWFSSLPGPTWPNRFFALTGSCHGQALMPEGWKNPQLATYFNQTQDTIFDLLNEARKSWKVYYYDFPSSLLLNHQRQLHNLVHYHHIGQFYLDCGKESTFPEFAFIEPKYFGADQNDDHPPHNIIKAEKLIADVYNGIRSSPDLWASSLLVVTFDEHGGFYDHVVPPVAVPPDDFSAKIDPDDPSKIFRFDRLGVRVPAVLVSPWIPRRVENTQFDHTSLLRYMIDKWGLRPMGLGARTANATPISVAIRGLRRDDTPGFVRVPYTDLIPPDPALEREDSSAHHKALQTFAYYWANERGDVEAVNNAIKEPTNWTRLKARIGKTMLTAGAALASDLAKFNKAKVDGTMRGVEDVIRGARAQV